MYAHSTLVLNGKTLSLDSFVSNQYPYASAFEQHAASFVRSWLSNQNSFTLNTSGSTGEPKPVTFTRHQLQASANATLQALNIRENQSALVCLPTRYVAGVMMLTRALVGNLRLLLVEPSADPLDAIGIGSVDFGALTPYQVETLLGKYGLAGINTIRTCIIGGAETPPAIRRQLHNASSAVWQTYGMTETLSHIALQRLSGPSAKDFFTTLPGVVIGLDERGCLTIQTPYLDAAVVTNDVVEILSENQFRWKGRHDNVINSGGVKIHPEMVEPVIGAVLEELGIVAPFFLGPLPDDKLGQKAVLVIESQPHTAPILDRLRTVLNRYEVPKEVHYTHPFQRTETGKVKRVATLSQLPI